MRVIWGNDSLRETELMEKIWRFRHDQFVTRLGWMDLAKEDGREIDLFDTYNAIHLAVLVDDEVAAYTRLLPTAAPHLLSDVYPEVMAGRDWPRGHTIYEWTRCIASEKILQRDGLAVSSLLVAGVMEFCLVAGIDKLVVETHPKLVGQMVATGWQTEILAPPCLYKDYMVVPVVAVPSPEGLLKLHQMTGIGHSLLDLSRQPVMNPLTPSRKLMPLDYIAEKDPGGEEEFPLRFGWLRA